MSHYVSLKDMMLLDFSNESDCPEELLSTLATGDFEGAAELLNFKYQDFLEKLLHHTFIDTEQYYFCDNSTRRSNFNKEEIWTGPHWVGTLRKDLDGFSTEHSVFQELATQEKYEGFAEEVCITVKDKQGLRNKGFNTLTEIDH